MRTNGVQRAFVNKWVRLLIVAGTALTLDACSKAAVEGNLRMYEQREVIGEYLRLTYIRNPGAAFGITLGPNSSLLFAVITGVAVAGLVFLYARTPAHDRRQLLAIALLCGGALGNLWNRVVSREGVVDWIDIGVGGARWPVFNFADIAVTAGAILLATALWQEGAPDGTSRGRPFQG